MRIAVVGYGRIAELHAGIAAADGHTLEWVVGRVPERAAAFAAQHGIRRHGTELAAVLADPAVDAVMLCTPNEQHAPQAKACLMAGKPVFVELPLAMSFAEGVELDRLSGDLGLTLMVGHTNRYLGTMRRVTDMVARGDIAFEHVVARYLLRRRTNVGSSGYVRSWTDSLLFHHANHALDMTLCFLGVRDTDQVEVVSIAAPPDPIAGRPLDLTVIVRTRCGRMGTVAASYNNDLPQLYDFLLAGRERSLALDNDVLRDRDGVIYDPKDEPDAPNCRVLQDREFFAAVRDGRPAEVDARSVLPALQVLDQIQARYDAAFPVGATLPTLNTKAGMS